MYHHDLRFVLQAWGDYLSHNQQAGTDKKSIAEGIMAYNSEGNVSYLEAINGHLLNMGCEEIEVTKK